MGSRANIPLVGSSCNAYQNAASALTSRLCRCFVPTLVTFEKNALVDVFNTNNGLAWPRLEGSGWDNPNSDPVWDDLMGDASGSRVSFRLSSYSSCVFCFSR